MKRGEIWRYQPVIARPGASTLRLIISAAAINDNPSLAVVLTVHVLASDPGGLLAVRTDPHGWASALMIEATVRSRMVEHVGTVDPDAMDQVSTALRAAQDL